MIAFKTCDMEKPEKQAFYADNIRELIRKRHFLLLYARDTDLLQGHLKLFQHLLIQQGFNGKAGPAWKIAFSDGGRDPIWQLATALSQRGILSEKKARPDYDEYLYRLLQEDRMGLIKAIRAAAPLTGHNLLIVVDHLYDAMQSEKEARAAGQLLDLIRTACTHADTALYVVLLFTEEAYRGLLAQVAWAGYRDYLESHSLHIQAALTQQEMERSFLWLAGQANVKVDEVLKKQILDELYFAPEQARKMQNYIAKIKSGWSGGEADSGKEVSKRIRVEKETDPKQTDVPLAEQTVSPVSPTPLIAVKQTSGTGEALSAAAEEIYGQLATAYQQYICERIFKTITFKNQSGGLADSSPVKFGDLCKYTQLPEGELEKVIQKFREKGMMGISGSGFETDSIVYLSAEELLRHWPRVGQWVEAESECIQFAQELNRRASQYEAGKDKSLLLASGDLERAMQLTQSEMFIGPWAERHGVRYEAVIAFVGQHTAADSDIAPAHSEQAPIPDNPAVENTPEAPASGIRKIVIRKKE